MANFFFFYGGGEPSIFFKKIRLVTVDRGRGLLLKFVFFSYVLVFLGPPSFFLFAFFFFFFIFDILSIR